MISLLISLLRKIALDRILKALLYSDEKLSANRSDLLKETELYLKEKEDLLAKRESQLIAEKEALLGVDGIELKKSILMPAMKRKWEAEKLSLDSERVNLIKNSPKVKASVEAMRSETAGIIDMIKSKPANSSNSNLLSRAEERLRTIDDVLILVDRIRNEK